MTFSQLFVEKRNEHKIFSQTKQTLGYVLLREIGKCEEEEKVEN